MECIGEGFFGDFVVSNAITESYEFVEVTEVVAYGVFGDGGDLILCKMVLMVAFEVGVFLLGGWAFEVYADFDSVVD